MNIHRSIRFSGRTRGGDSLSVEVPSSKHMLLDDENGSIDIGGSCEITPELAKLMIELLTCGLECLSEQQQGAKP